MPDEQGIVSQDELKKWGFLGKPPARLLDAPSWLIARWRNLAAAAQRVASMPRGERRTEAAKDIEHKRAALIRDIDLNLGRGGNN